MDSIIFYDVEKNGKKMELILMSDEDSYEFNLGWFASYAKEKFTLREALDDVVKLFEIKILQECK
jgi:hypothetical protein